MRKDTRNLAIVLGNYFLFTAFTALGGYLFVSYPHNEALGGIVLGVTGVILGIIIPFHVWRAKLVDFTIFPVKDKGWKVFVATLIFTALLVGIYPSGMLGNNATVKVLSRPPCPAEASITFLFLLFSAAIYALMFWGGILHAIQKIYGTIAAVIVTSLLFSLYHIAEFAFTPLALEFFIMMFVSGLMCTMVTIFSKSVLPTLLAQQFGQFMHFMSLEENPFNEAGGLISNTILLLLCLGIYAVLSKKMEWNNPVSREYKRC